MLTAAGCVIDLVIILDDSNSINAGWEPLKNFAASLVNALDVGPAQARVGLVKFSNNANNEFYLNTFVTKNEVITAILDLQLTGGQLLFSV